jgi:hypothetical protein
MRLPFIPPAELSPEQGNVRLLGKTFEQPVSLGAQHVGAIAAHRSGRRTPGRAEPLRPLHHTGYADLKRRRKCGLEGWRIS